MWLIVTVMQGINNTKFPWFAFMVQFPVLIAKRGNYNKIMAVLLYLKWKDFEHKNYGVHCTTLAIRFSSLPTFRRTLQLPFARWRIWSLPILFNLVYGTANIFFLSASQPIVGLYSQPPLSRFLDHTQRRTTFGRTPPEEWSVRRRDLYPKTHNTHNRQTSMPPVEFEPTISAGARP